MVNKNQHQFTKYYTKGIFDRDSDIKPHYAKAKLDVVATYACIIASGTNLGILKMADICDLSFSNLNSTYKN